ncbi:MAG: hypothetical protein ACKV2Q_17805 [Planctomycetaceae bacterium]
MLHRELKFAPCVQRQQAAHPGLTMTGMYNVLEKLRNPATDKPTQKAITLPDQVQAIRQHLATAEKPLTAADVTKLFTRANVERIEEVLETLVLTGTARRLCGGKFVSS